MQYTSYVMSESPVLSQIGHRVRARRASMGWTLREVAERSGIDGLGHQLGKFHRFGRRGNDELDSRSGRTLPNS